MGRKSKSATTKDVAKRQKGGDLSTIVFDKSLMDEQAIDNEDILIPKLWLMQSNSKLVIAKKAKIGEYRDSITTDLICEEGEALEMFIFAPYKTWQCFIEKKNGKKFDKKEYVETLNYADNLNLAVDEEDEDGNLIHRDKVLGFYALLVKDIEEKTHPFPYVVDFKRTSAPAGKIITTFIAKLRAEEMPCYAQSFNLSAISTTNDDGTFCVKQIEVGRTIKQKEIPKIEGWVKSLKKLKESQSVEVDESDNNTQAKTTKKTRGSKKEKDGNKF